nr:DGQHR domain-containing protein [Cupriavidus pauculus]
MLDFDVPIEVPCIKVEQPIGTFFIAAMNSVDLCEITVSDVRRLEGEREVETYLGIQRPLSRKRVDELKEYVRTVDACFPTGVILAIDSRCAEYNDERKTLTLRAYADKDDPERSVNRIEIAKVLDGQHRIEGLRGYTGSRFEVNVSIFIDMDIENQAYVFSTVNLAQTKVNKSLVYDLYEYSRARSPQKTCHNIAVALDKLESSAFHERIKRLGSATRGRTSETLTQATFVEALLPYFTTNKIADRDLYLRGKRPKAITSDESRKLIFRNMFIDERDMDIADIIHNFFGAVRDRWPQAWNHGGDGQMLNKTNGFRALVRVLRDAYLHLVAPGEVVSQGAFMTLLRKSTLDDGDFTTDRFLPGTSGETSLYLTLCQQIGVRARS